MAAQQKANGYVYSLDWVRALTIVAVVMVHSIRFALVPSQPISGNLLQLFFQFGRESFMLVTGFIIAYQYRERAPNWLRFFKRRGKSAALPYLVWLAVFLIPDVPLWHPAAYLARYWQILPNGNGHLYYMVITLQMYVLAPFLIAALQRLPKLHVALGVSAVLWETLSWTMTGYFHQHWSPALFVSTYVGWFVLGGVLGVHWPELKRWMVSHRGWFVPGLGVALLATTLVFFIDVGLFSNPAAAVNVFQPISVFYTLFIFLALLASGTWYETARERLGHTGRTIGIIADASFGIYLVHPLFVHGWLNFAAAHGIGVNPYADAVLTCIIGVAFSTAAVFLIRFLPFSEAIIGTVRAARSPRPLPASQPSASRTRATAVE